MTLNFTFEEDDGMWGYKGVFCGLKKHFLQNNCGHNINFRMSQHLNDQKNVRDKYGAFCLTIENTENGKYFLISYWDKIYDLLEIPDFNNCVELFTSAGGHSDDYFYNSVDYNYTPSSYTGCLSHNEVIIDNLYKQERKRNFNGLSFRGYLYNFRQYLKNDNRYKITDQKILEPELYFEELNNNLVNLSLNGAAEICHRDIELLGLGTAMIRSELVTKFHNNLIPDFHYISIPINDIDKNNMNEYYKELSDRIINRYEEVKNDIDFVKFVGENGRKWYEENGTVKSNVDILKKIINIDKLL